MSEVSQGRAPGESLQEPAFTVMRGVRGTAHTFQVYLRDGNVYFIRLAGGPGGEMAAAASGGLIGAVIAWWISSRRQKKQAQRAIENRAKTLEQMLGDHKVNHLISANDIEEASLDPGNWAMKKGTVIWRFRVRGEKKPSLATFVKPQDVQRAVEALPAFLPALQVNVRWDEMAQKYL